MTALSQIFGDTVVAQGATLTIEPGVKVIFEPRADTTRGYNLVISGGLVARGNGSQVVTFTAQDPTSLGRHHLPGHQSRLG